MTQPSGPYSVPYQYSYPQGYGFDPLSQYLAPARRASILMFILGGLGFACGICVGLVTFLVPMERFIQESGMQLPELSELGMSPVQFVRIVYGIVAGLVLVTALVLIILAAFVRRGGLGSIVTAIVLCGIGLIILVIQFIAVLVQLRSQGPLQSLLALAINVAMLAMFGLQLMWLIQAARAAPVLKAARAHLQAQQWQYQQQMYPQPPYGYAQQQPPPPTA